MTVGPGIGGGRSIPPAAELGASTDRSPSPPAHQPLPAPPWPPPEPTHKPLTTSKPPSTLTIPNPLATYTAPTATNLLTASELLTTNSLTASDPRMTSQPLTASKPLTAGTVLTALALGALIGLLVGGVAGLVAALLTVPVATVALHRQESPQTQRDRERIAADLPFAADLMTACLLAGRPVSSATETAAEAVGGPLGQRLTWVSTQLRLGADPEPTWATLSDDPGTRGLARAMSRAAQTGAPVADVLTRLADDARDAARASALAAARRVGVKAVAPLGLCFLPAFVLLGIVPVVAGLASTIALP
ncbi:Type II secretion system (T2SS), protein F [Nonomuraea pusilla]|uniref:Type II secretion system (T2SS), protein F n=2 Tax=Nonomuraea pusilla TaxID=46177 RepID=A0A1H7QTT2_9ACTN|nr:Type II secretion system (T2SS), protein F [Nonomuraea pusilla]